MKNWQAMNIASFLTERQGRYKPYDKQIQNIPRLDKIDFSGTIHLSSKPTKTDMIIIEQGDLVISGINVAKGAIAIWQGKRPIAATIHYSSYIFDKEKIDIDFFKRYLKSPVFIKALQAQVKGGIKTEIKAKNLLPLMVNIPPLPIQCKIKKHFETFESKLSNLNNEIENQDKYLIKLRQAILQEAIEGKLTTDWRKNNPVRKGDERYDAEALLEKIKKERNRKERGERKEKMLSPIKAKDMPFALPKGWMWTRLGEICDFQYGKALSEEFRNNNGKYPVYGANGIKNYSNKYNYDKKTIVAGRKGSAGELNLTERYFWALDVTYFIVFNENLLNLQFLYKLLLTLDLPNLAKGVKPGLNRNEVYELIIPIPPLSEQYLIVERVEKRLSFVNNLEIQVKERKIQMGRLWQTVLQDVFDNN
ncbi:MAG: restriction endonuclease subunit S [Elusimicrobiota bacterium]|jgi:type I restriction enzyme S subunit|nr:restriction endonuclease subunit S [Elusimicrobiota bacterium]